jgi:two-component system, OmpR family, sensor kinase
MSSGPPTERPVAGPRRRGPAGWSLRARLVAAMIGLLAVVCLAVGATTEVVLHRVLQQQVDDRLMTTADRPGPQRGREGDRHGPPGREGTITAWFNGGTVIDAVIVTESGVEAPVPDRVVPVLAGVPADQPPRTYHLDTLGDYRLVARSGRDGATQVTALPLAEAEDAQLWVAGVGAIVTVLALVLAGFAGAFIVRRTMRPLSRVADTATRVSELRLDRGEVALAERVPPADTDPRTEVGRVGAALNRMLEHVGGALEARHASETQVRQFVADASHELRTPLAAIRGYAELSRRGRDPVPPDVAHALRRVESEAQRMTTLVEDMLLLARLDAGRPLDLRPVDLTALAVDAVSDAHAAGPEHKWRLDVPDEPVTVTGDPARLHQAVANLLANARTHTPEGTEVTVTVAVEPAGAVLRITDTGPGIPAELRPYIFERFSRGDTSRSRAAGSTGLGLAIVAAVVAAHGGAVEVDSEPGQTVFTVRLPA